MSITIRHRWLGTIPLLECVPEDLVHKTLPLIIYYHGWRSHKELNLTAARRLARLGCRVIVPDAANHGERQVPVQGIPSQTFWQSIQSNLFEFSYIVDFFQRRQLASDQVAVAGVSMGGMTIFALLTQHPNIQAAAALMGTPQPLAYAERLYQHAKAAQRFMPDDYFKLIAWLENYDLSRHSERLGQRPLFIWHGRQDQRVPFDQTEAFVKENPAAHIHFLAEDAGHLVDIDTTKAMVNFFDQHFIRKDPSTIHT
ncbi:MULTISPECIES: alpha/beta fold hydrolase [Aerococcus]|uniref:alpha/beta fold hydrolase n=1 Tax=Aerococcus urinae (strain CCUG 59500 / ACS-120-V-Col10a) TaxID=2976812 RepID=UPI000200F3E5|nr:alpha/beta fold hydrolase [Aerococcus sp. Group 1]AEA01550.1 hypothetical protein HMPREF9243_1945 [Aerococcus sp. Group 1]MCY3030327.1 alpha/beta fold hydrolase [Aerococcus sp. Group 1]MCY3055424.1 alpha/beta fold hydrolase [Aerococcus sp. Group 1]MCY3057154.1 alpha/beta fold hydrolase [Aerococcus sp. Group 1]MCY3061516.1 alpha/beta fold hydrolase [Aerococcus sp. Group 1]